MKTVMLKAVDIRALSILRVLPGPGLEKRAIMSREYM